MIKKCLKPIDRHSVESTAALYNKGTFFLCTRVLNKYLLIAFVKIVSPGRIGRIYIIAQSTSNCGTVLES